MKAESIPTDIDSGNAAFALQSAEERASGLSDPAYGPYITRLPGGTFTAQPPIVIDALRRDISPYTVSMRFCLPQPSGLMWTAPGTAGLLAMPNPHDQGKIQFAMPGAVTDIDAPTVETGRWYYVTIVADASPQSLLYVDGVMTAWKDARQGFDFKPLNSPIQIAAHQVQQNNGPVQWYGTPMDLADIRIWNGTRSQDQIIRDMAKFDPSDPSLIVRADFTRRTPAITKGPGQEIVPTLTYGITPAVHLRGTLIQDVAQKVAPLVRLHPEDDYRPVSVAWFLNRSKLLQGSGVIETSYAKVTGLIPASVQTKVEGPLTPETLKAACSGPTNTDDFGLWPMEAPSGSSPTYKFLSAFSDYQVETLHGEPIVNNKCTSECYCHITQVDDYFNLTYYFIYSYNGGMGPRISTAWHSMPLATGSGYMAHIGDIERVTVQLSINDDSSVKLRGYIYEWHGNKNVVAAPPNSAAIPPDKLTPTTVYSCWHSHASWPSKGEHPTDTVLANDYSDDGGPLWNTGDNLVFVSSKSGQAWLDFNGDFGADIKVTDGVVGPAGAWAQKVGPEGPKYKDSWKDLGTEWFVDGTL